MPTNPNPRNVRPFAVRMRIGDSIVSRLVRKGGKADITIYGRDRGNVLEVLSVILSDSGNGSRRIVIQDEVNGKCLLDLTLGESHAPIQDAHS